MLLLLAYFMGLMLCTQSRVLCVQSMKPMNQLLGIPCVNLYCCVLV